MTSRTIRNGPGHPFPGGFKEIVISCDTMSCTKAVNNTEIQASGGLKAMGWTTAYLNNRLNHYCPEHSHEE